MKYTGVVDEFRVLKPGAAIYQAQADPLVAPVIAPAFYWDFGPVSPVTSLSGAMICSNLDRLEVYVGGQHFATVTPDSADYANLVYPPSFVDFSTVDGSSRPELRIDGYLGPELVASRSLASDPSLDALALAADDREIDGDGVDATRVVFRAVDRYGAPRPYVDRAGDLGCRRTGGADRRQSVRLRLRWRRRRRLDPLAARLAGHGHGHRQPPDPGQRHGAHTGPRGAAGRPSRPVRHAASAGSAGAVMPGGTTTVTATFANNGILTLDGVGFAATAPSGWAATMAPTVIPRPVRSGEVIKASWHVAVPPDAHLGQAPITVQTVYTAGDQRGVSYGSVSVLGGYATLAGAFNNTGISADADVTAADFDGTGTSYSEQALTSVGFGPGAVITHDRLTFTWPDVPAGQPDNVVAAGQTILLSGSGTTLGFLVPPVPPVTAARDRLLHRRQHEQVPAHAGQLPRSADSGQRHRRRPAVHQRRPPRAV